MPAIASMIRRLDGNVKNASVFERMKNIGACVSLTSCRNRGGLVVLLAPGRVARLGVLVGRIEARQFCATFHFAHDPALIKFVLGTLVRDEFDEVLRNDDGAVVIEHNDVAREDCAATARDRLLPANEGQSVDRCGRGDPRAPDR